MNLKEHGISKETTEKSCKADKDTRTKGKYLYRLDLKLALDVEFGERTGFETNYKNYITKDQLIKIIDILNLPIDKNLL